MKIDKLVEMYAKEFEEGGNKTCLHHEKRQTHGELCSRCLRDVLLVLGVSDATLRIAEKTFKKPKSTVVYKETVALIKNEIRI